MTAEFPDIPTRVEKFENATQFSTFEKLPNGRMLFTEVDKQKTQSIWVSTKIAKEESTYYVEVEGELYRYDKDATRKLRGLDKPVKRSKVKK